ncbi:MAG TPA: hypothetical protein VKG91_10405 [Roseiarcus sp.]|nr:hypothetical protein [Roseiarcus sp.]
MTSASRIRAGSIVKAAIAYFAVVFAFGFAIGAGRVFWLQPRVGETTAVAFEAPVMIGVSWLACAKVIGWAGTPATAPARLAMGALALAVLLTADAMLGSVGFGRSLGEQLTAFGRLPGAIGLAAQCLFALMPLLQRKNAG